MAQQKLQIQQAAQTQQPQPRHEENLKQARRLTEFYQNKTILITGATGFIGKVCLLKLMCALGNCNKVFVMLRPKKGLTPQQRFNKMIADAPFNPNTMDGNNMPPGVREQQVHIVQQIRAIDWSKVVPIEGDMSAHDLGLPSTTKDKLLDQVEIIFNVAASVQFDAPLKQNLRDNYLGASNIMQLALKCTKLISLVHVSTFYSNHHVDHVEERVLPMERNCEKMAELINWMPEDVLKSVEPHIMENRPNTYIFTKAMAENLVMKYQDRLPVAIVRPSIVTPSNEYPEPGWVDNVNGPMGLGTLGAIGILRNIDWNYWGVGDFVPVDFVVHTMLVVAERTVRLREMHNDTKIKVYNCSTSSLKPVTWGESFEALREVGLEAPPYKMLRIPIEVPKHKRANRVMFALTKLNELLFAYLIDFLLVLCGQKRILARLTAKMHNGYQILLPFTAKQWTCSNDNLLAAWNEMHPEDQKQFDFNLKALDWRKSFQMGYYGTRKRILKESYDNIPAAVFKMKVLNIVETTFKVLFIGLLMWLSFRTYTSFASSTISTATATQMLQSPAATLISSQATLKQMIT